MLASDFSNNQTILQKWKSLRSTLTKTLSDHDHLTSVVQFWATCPIQKRILDWDRPDLWPDPWQLIYENHFDECAISLAMFYTLILSADSRWTAERLKLMLLKNTEHQFQGIVLQVDSEYILNYEYNTLYKKSSLGTGTMVQRQYRYENNRFSYPNLHVISAYQDQNLTQVN